MESLDQPRGGWLRKVGGTAELLKCVPPVVSAKVLDQWQQRGLVQLHNPGLGRGKAVERLAVDALQVSTFAEVAALGVQLGHAGEAWLCVRERVAFGAPWSGVLIARTPEADYLAVRPFGADPDLDAVLADLGRPAAFAVLHLAPLFAGVVRRVAQLEKECAS